MSIFPNKGGVPSKGHNNNQLTSLDSHKHFGQRITCYDVVADHCYMGHNKGKKKISILQNLPSPHNMYSLKGN